MNYYRLWNVGAVTWHVKEKIVKNASVYFYRNRSQLARNLIRQNAECRLPVCSCNIHVSTSNNRTANVTVDRVEHGTFKKILKKIGWFDVSKSTLRRSSYILYEHVADHVNYSAFMKGRKSSSVLKS